MTDIISTFAPLEIPFSRDALQCVDLCPQNDQQIMNDEKRLILKLQELKSNLIEFEKIRLFLEGVAHQKQSGNAEQGLIKSQDILNGKESQFQDVSKSLTSTCGDIVSNIKSYEELRKQLTNELDALRSLLTENDTASVANAPKLVAEAESRICALHAELTHWKDQDAKIRNVIAERTQSLRDISKRNSNNESMTEEQNQEMLRNEMLKIETSLAWFEQFCQVVCNLYRVKIEANGTESFQLEIEGAVLKVAQRDGKLIGAELSNTSVNQTRFHAVLQRAISRNDLKVLVREVTTMLRCQQLVQKEIDTLLQKFPVKREASEIILTLPHGVVVTLVLGVEYPLPFGEPAQITHMESFNGMPQYKIDEALRIIQEQSQEKDLRTVTELVEATASYLDKSLKYR